MSQIGIEQAFFDSFSDFGYTYVDYPNGAQSDIPSTAINYAVSIIYADGAPTGIGADSTDRYRGIFQVTIRAPLLNTNGDPAGTYEAGVQAAVIANRYKKGTSISYPVVSPTTYVHCKTPIIKHLGNIDDTWYYIVISCYWWADVII